jgi:hypothetical protein
MRGRKTLRGWETLKEYVADMGISAMVALSCFICWRGTKAYESRFLIFIIGNGKF